MLLQLENLTYIYQSPFSPVRKALSGISLEVHPQEILAIVGATGSGKTTLIQHFNGLLKPTEGRVLVDSRDIFGPQSDLGWVRKRIGLVFQFPEIQLFEDTVYDDIAFGPRNLGLSEKLVEHRIRSSLKLVDFDFQKFSKLSPFQLSGGEKRRVAIAGVLAMEPEVLILDEPTVGLDQNAAARVEEILKRYHRQGRTIIFVSHNMDLVARLASRVVVLKKGKLQFDGSKVELFQNKAILEDAGLVLPQVCQFMQNLRKQGFSVRTDVFTVEEAKEEIGRVLGNKFTLHN